MRFRLVSVLLLAFVVIAAGCGGGGKKNSASPASTGTTASTTSAGTTVSASPSFASTKNCARLITLGAQLSQAFQTTSGNAEQNLANEDKLFQAMADAAPSDIRGDFQTFAQASTAYGQALVKAGLKAGQTPTAAQVAQLQAAAKTFSTPKLRTAELHLSAWAKKNCGYKTTTTG